jgi:8-oxo-dGTP pyrophosphatase MutT (NUDIX family)
MLEIRCNHPEYNQDVPLKIASRALIIKDNKVAVLYSQKYKAYMTPGGGLERGESLEEACIREAKEETGILVKPLEKIAILDCNYPKIRIVHHYFVCDYIEDLEQIQQTLHEQDQDLILKWLTLEEVKQAYGSHTEMYKYDIWMQYESIIIPELRKYLINKS